MRLASIPQIYRHVNRWGEILGVLSKYELAGWVGRLGPEFVKDFLKSQGGEALARLPWETRVRMALTELGPTFIKLGQALSTRPDLVGVAMADELQNLQWNAPADPPEVVKAAVEQELGRPLEELFAEFEPTAMASASIGQVHRARLHSGEAVVVKVLHRDIERKIAVDLDILAGLAQLAEKTHEFRNYRPQAVVHEFQRTMRRELDFGRELRHLEHFGRSFCDNPTVHIPVPHPKLSSRRVLTMELIEGVKFCDLGRTPPPDFDAREVARRGANLYLEMIFVHGIYHADPHPGNIVVMKHDVIGLLDFGMVGRLDETLQEDISEMLMAVADRDARMLTSVIVRAGQTPPGLDRSALEVDVGDFVAHYGSMSLERFDLGGALREMTEIIRRYSILLPAPLAMILKVLITLEGSSRLVCPQFGLVEIMAPYQQKLMWRRFSPRRQLRKFRRLYSEIEHLVGILPRGLTEILQQVQTGKFDVHLDHRGLEPSVNRLVLGMLASALFLGSSLLLSRDVPPLLFEKLSIPGMAGVIISFALGVRLWRAISRSGRLDQR
jgi:ubiquinone biosynthesis protein